MAINLSCWLIIAFLWTGCSAKYTLELKVGTEEFSDSFKVNYVILKGHLATSPRININEATDGSVDTSLLTISSVNRFLDLIPSDYGYIYSITIGNDGDSLQLTDVTITDVDRGVTYQKTLTKPNGWIDASSNIKLMFKVDGQWSAWDTTWTTCSKTCAGGTKSRNRACTNPAPSTDGAPCPGSAVESQDCNVFPCPVNGGWTDWTTWTTCSVTCGGGTQSRTRSCTNPTPAYQGTACLGLAKENQGCNQDISCPVNGGWSEWSTWSTCSVTCSGGIRTSTRMCNSPEPAHGGLPCSDSPTRSEVCNEQTCAVDGAWSAWEPLGQCSLPCPGVQTFRRRCDNPAPLDGGKPCEGPAEKTQHCTLNLCTVDGGWSEWQAWSQCSLTCGSGSKSRVRVCDNPTPSGGGLACVGIADEIANCNTDNCPINGGWSPWTTWGSCSLTCGPGGTKIRDRSCTEPSPAFGGAECPGGIQDVRECLDNPSCSVDGYWQSWSEWGACSVTCAEGTQSRSRICVPPLFGGKDCSGDRNQSRICMLQEHCPVDGGWTHWTNWTDCSKNCGAGISRRSRNCSNPVTKYGGKNCTGAALESKECFKVQFCPIDGVWGDWSDWTSCSVTCGDGVQTRRRYCDSPEPQHEGAYCLPCQNKDINSKIVPHCDQYKDLNNKKWLPEIATMSCSKTQCFDDLRDLANALVANVLAGFQNGSGNVSESESMKKAFAVVDQISGLLENQLDKVKPGDAVLLETPDLAIAVAKVGGDAKSQDLASGDKGKMSVGIGNAGDAFDGATLKFSALDSKTFFKAASKKQSSAPVLGLKLTSGDEELNVTEKVSLGMELPNQNGETDANLLSPLTLSHSKKIIQRLDIESYYSAIKLSIRLENSTTMRFLFMPHQIPNVTADAHIIVTVFPNNTATEVFNGSLIVKTQLRWPNINFFIPGKQLPSSSYIYMVTYSTRSGPVASSNPLEPAAETALVTESPEQASTVMSIGVACITPRAWSSALGIWEEADIDVDENSSIQKAVFKSNFFGTFTAEIFIAPNTIDFADVFGNFGKKLSESFVVLIVLVICIGTYVLVGVLLWRKDRAEADLLRYEPLVDNDPNHDYSYIVSVHTSPISNAGTSANVFLNVLGKWGSSGHRRIHDGWRKQPFNNGSVTNFVMTTNASLGDLRILKIWHDNSGWSPSWHLEKVIIEDLQNKKLFIFMCDNWLSEDEYDNETERILPEVKSDIKYQQQFVQMKLGGVLDNHVMLTLFRNTGQSNYTRLQKLSVCVAMFFLLMISDAMFFGKDDDLPAAANFKIDFGPISLTWFQIYTGIISVAITYPCVFICADIFRRTKRWRRRWTDDEVSKMKKEWNLPRWFLGVAWMLIILAIAVSAFFTFLYSLEWGAEKSGQWLKAFILGIFGMVLMTDPLVLLFVYVLAKKMFSARTDDNELVNVDDFLGDEAKKILGSAEKKLRAEKLEAAKLEKANEKKLTRTFHDCLTYVVYLFLLLAIAYDSREQITYTQNTALKGFFYPSGNTFQTFHDVYNWLANTALVNTYPNSLYNGWERTGDDLVSVDFCDCMRQGPFRLRQIRVRRNTCKIPYQFAKAFGPIPCNEGYNLNSVQRNSFDPTWAAKSDVVFNRTAYKKRHPSPPETVVDAFRYQSSEDSGGFPFEGTFGFYEGGGYVASMGMNTREASYIINNLRSLKWMDKLTRALFYEGTLYNWNSNLFTTVQIVFEMPPSGGVIVYPSGIRTYRLYNYVGGKGMVLMMMQGLFLVIVGINIIREFSKIVTQKKAYFKDQWNVLELISIIISLVIILTTGIRIQLTIDAVERMMNNKGFYVAFDNVSTWVETTCIVLGLSCFVSILRVLKFLGFNKHIAIMQATISLSASQLSSFAVVFICFFIAFICSGHLLFALTEVNFADVLVMGRTLFGASLGIITFGGMFNSEYSEVNVMYYYAWATLSVFFLMSAFISILDDTYSKVLEECLYDYDKELVDHMWNKFSKIMNAVGNATKSAVGKKPPEVESKPLSSTAISLDFNEIPETPRDKDARYKQMNPSLRKKIAELNNDKMNEAELNLQLNAFYNSQTGSADGILLSPQSFTNIQDLPEEESLESRLPRFKSSAGGGAGRLAPINATQCSMDLPGLAPPLAPAFNVDIDRFDLSTGQERKVLRTYAGDAVSISLPTEQADRKKKSRKSRKSHRTNDNI